MVQGAEEKFGPKGDDVTGVENTTWQVALWSVLVTKCYLGDQIKKKENGGACGVYGKQERFI